MTRKFPAHVDAKLRAKLVTKVIANGTAVRATIPTVQRGVTHYTPTTTWMDDEVRKLYPSAQPEEPMIIDGDTVRLYFFEDAE